MSVISQADMEAVYTVTDALGISREAITVPLGKKDPGEVRDRGGQLRITLPASVDTSDWLPTLRAELERLGHGASG